MRKPNLNECPVTTSVIVLGNDMVFIIIPIKVFGFIKSLTTKLREYFPKQLRGFRFVRKRPWLVINILPPPC